MERNYALEARMRDQRRIEPEPTRMGLSDQLEYVAANLMGRKEVDGVGVNDLCNRAAAQMKALQFALAGIYEATAKKQLPLTSQINEAAEKALLASGYDPR